MTLTGLHDVIFQKIELFITTAVRTSNPTHIKRFKIKMPGKIFRPMRGQETGENYILRSFKICSSSKYC
jgi:hypothetical protein